MNQIILMKETNDHNFQSNCPNNINYQSTKQGLIFEERLQSKSVCSVCLKELDESICRIIKET